MIAPKVLRADDIYWMAEAAPYIETKLLISGFSTIASQMLIKISTGDIY